MHNTKLSPILFVNITNSQQLSCTLNRWKKVNNNDDSLDHLYQCKFVLWQKRKIENWQMESLHFYGMIILVKTVPLCRGMAWLPFQKDFLSFPHMTGGNKEFRIPFWAPASIHSSFLQNYQNNIYIFFFVVLFITFSNLTHVAPMIA